jgi:hypothetical protein
MAGINSIDGIHGASMRERKWEREIWRRRFGSAGRVPGAGHDARPRAARFRARCRARATAA